MQRISSVTEKSRVAPGALVHLISTSDDDLGLQDRLRRRSARRACGVLRSLGWEGTAAGTRYLWLGAAWGARQVRRHGRRRVGGGGRAS